MNLQLSLKKQWFEMTKAGIKTEDYREITPYLIKRLTSNDIDLTIEEIESGLCTLRDGYSEDHVWEVYGFCLKIFTVNTMTLGYPKSTDTERILKLEHKGIEIRQGNPEWGAEHGKIYLVIKHGQIL